jgi:hypothetical protein
MTGLATVQLMLARQEEAEHPLVVDPNTHEAHRVATPLSTPSNTNTHSTPATSVESLPSVKPAAGLLAQLTEWEVVRSEAYRGT